LGIEPAEMTTNSVGEQPRARRVTFRGGAGKFRPAVPSAQRRGDDIAGQSRRASSVTARRTGIDAAHLCAGSPTNLGSRSHGAIGRNLLGPCRGARTIQSRTPTRTPGARCDLLCAAAARGRATMPWGWKEAQAQMRGAADGRHTIGPRGGAGERRRSPPAPITSRPHDGAATAPQHRLEGAGDLAVSGARRTSPARVACDFPRCSRSGGTARSSRASRRAACRARGPWKSGE